MFSNTNYDIHQVNAFRFIQEPHIESKSGSIICLHGMFGGLSNFDNLIENTDDYTIYVPDIPLYTLPKSNLTISGLAEWLKEFVDVLNINDPILLGNSMGGHVALEYAVQFPDTVRGLILTGSSGLMEKGFGSSVPRRNDPDYIREQASLTFYDDLVDDAMVKEILEVVQSPSKLRRLLWIARNTQQHNMEDQLPKISVPTLLVWGKNDIITPPEVAETFCRKMPNAALKWIDRCGHAPMMERPEEFVLHLKEYLSTLGEQENLIQKKSKGYEKDYPHL